MAVFREMNRQGMTIVLATHNPALLTHCGRRLRCTDGVISDGGPATGKG
jgi:ABC-type ATPase involved in cell division